jgi:hypothetical protein
MEDREENTREISKGVILMAQQFQWTKEQAKVLDRMGLPFDYAAVAEDKLDQFESLVGDYLIEHGRGDNDELNDTGLVCETILDRITAV